MPSTRFDTAEKYRYQTGFNSYHESEAIADTLPVGQNSPQKVAYGLFAEKLSGTAFTAPRWENKQTWLYRVLPASAHSPFQPFAKEDIDDAAIPPPSEPLQQVPNQIRWDPFNIDPEADWVTGQHHISGAGDPTIKQGLGIHIYSCGRPMAPRTAYYSADGDLLIVPQQGTLDIQTELGHLLVRPNEICVLPRGVRHRVELPSGPARGYILELYEGHFQLPELGPIGSAGLAEPRDFQIPVAAFEHDAGSQHTLICKFAGNLFTATQDHTPFDVVAWHGTYYPYKYDLGRFATIGAISHDHPDPSIFTVLTAPSPRPGTAAADFVVFPPRWLVAENTFRPPWYHRNVMAEFMGLICGAYDAKKDGEGGFQPGGASLHNVMSGHGPDAATHKAASEADLKPVKVGEGSMAFMFESCYMLGVTGWGLRRCEKVQGDYSHGSWGGLEARFRFEEGMVRIGNLVNGEGRR